MWDFVKTAKREITCWVEAALQWTLLSSLGWKCDECDWTAILHWSAELVKCWKALTLPPALRSNVVTTVNPFQTITHVSMMPINDTWGHCDWSRWRQIMIYRRLASAAWRRQFTLKLKNAYFQKYFLHVVPLIHLDSSATPICLPLQQ